MVAGVPALFDQLSRIQPNNTPLRDRGRRFSLLFYSLSHSLSVEKQFSYICICSILTSYSCSISAPNTLN